MAITDLIISAESGGNPKAKNPRSTAYGAGQFIESTWLDMIARHRPDLMQGRSREQVLGLRTDPKLSRDMTAAYAADNAKKLTSAGLPANPATIYLAHFAGPQGAISLLKANPGDPVGNILGDKAMTANPFLQGMTVGDLQAWANGKMGITPQSAPTASPTLDMAKLVANGQMPANFTPPAGGAFGSMAPGAGQRQFDPAKLAAMGLGMMGGQQAKPVQLAPPPQRPPVDMSQLQALMQQRLGGRPWGTG